MAMNDSDKALLTSQKEEIASLKKSVGDLTATLSKTRAPGFPEPGQVNGVPNVRTGENPLTSRGFSFMKMLGMLTGAIPADQAKVELDMHDRMHQTLAADRNGGGYEYGGRGIVGQAGGKFLAPLSASYLPEDKVDRNFRKEMKSLVLEGVRSADPDEMGWIQKKAYGTKALSWLNELSGGALVAPPEMGELIELLRNKEALVNAGARTVPLPPQGRIRYPSQTMASTTYWVGENSPLTETSIGTGDVNMQAKKLTNLIKAPNELLRFASPAAEALIRDDMTKSMALALDLAGLEGLGGDTRPLGIINMQNINRITSSSPGQNGDALVGQDIYRMVAAIEESNAEMEAFVMRPKTLYAYYQLRAAAVAQGDSQGTFLFNLIREAGESTKAMLGGYPVTKSTQVSQNRSKGNASNLTYILAGMFSDCLIGMFGALEFAATTLGDQAFTNDQSWVRCIMSADITVRHQVSFCLLDNLSIGQQ